MLWILAEAVKIFGNFENFKKQLAFRIMVYSGEIIVDVTGKHRYQFITISLL